MLWLASIASVVSVGIVLGLRLRVPSVFAASLVLAVATVVFVPVLTEWSMGTMVVFLVALLCALQCGYLVGLAIAFGQTRVRSSDSVGLPPVGRHPSQSAGRR